MSTTLGDFRVGLRILTKAPGLAALIVTTLALGIGANSAIFSVIHSVLLREMPYPEADRLVQVWNKYPLIDLPQASISVPDYSTAANRSTRSTRALSTTSAAST